MDTIIPFPFSANSFLRHPRRNGDNDAMRLLCHLVLMKLCFITERQKHLPSLILVTGGDWAWWLRAYAATKEAIRGLVE
jgi:hypothetical protein